MFFLSLQDIVCVVAVAFATYLYRRFRRAPLLPLPPGPRKLPLIGNLLDLPTSYEWETYARWGKQYNSDIIHVNAMGTNIIAINSVNVANDLFTKRSTIYSSRPQFTMASELLGWSWLLAGMPYGKPWMEGRRLLQQHFPPSNGTAHKPRTTEFIRRLLIQILETPGTDIPALMRHTTGGIAISLAYGLKIAPFNDFYVDLAEKAVTSLTAALVPGAFLVDVLPWLKYVPEWVPGAGFQRKVRIFREFQIQFREKPFADSIKNLANGTARTSFTSMALDSLDGVVDRDHQYEIIKDTAGVFFAGGAETTTVPLKTFFLAMMCFPEVQAKCHDEIDQVMGQRRLPEFGDEENLPYLAAVLKEVIRWRVVAPIAIPHELTKDDIYDGYYLPAKSIVVGNVWAMLNDGNDYPSPSVFNPERFLNEDGALNPDVPDPMNVIFGFGRRECPGKHIALSTIWLAAASILSAFEIEKAVDNNGHVIEPDLQYSSSLVCHPEPFRCTLKARSVEMEQLLRSMATDYTER